MSIPEIKRLKSKPQEISYEIKSTSYGDMMVGVCSDGICWAGFDLDGSVMKSRFPSAKFKQENISTAGSPIAVYGTDFQLSVWKTLCNIDEGSTLTYGEIANTVGKPKAHRAVGSAVGANPISGFIPCHRVLPAQGGVGNYLWGSEKKRELLKQERVSL